MAIHGEIEFIFLIKSLKIIVFFYNWGISNRRVTLEKLRSIFTWNELTPDLCRKFCEKSSKSRICRHGWSLSVRIISKLFNFLPLFSILAFTLSWHFQTPLMGQFRVIGIGSHVRFFYLDILKLILSKFISIKPRENFSSILNIKFS